jgi:hypothetical protein
MKKLIIIMIAAFVPAILVAQNTPLSSFYDDYQGKPGFETTEIHPDAMSFEGEKNVDNARIKELMQSVEAIRILKYKTESGTIKADKLWKKMQKTASDKQYKEAVTVDAENIRVNIYIMKGTEGKTREVAILGKNDKGIMLMTVTGNMDFSQIFSKENMKSLREMGEYYLKNNTCKPEGQK